MEILTVHLAELGEVAARHPVGHHIAGEVAFTQQMLVGGQDLGIAEDLVGKLNVRVAALPECLVALHELNQHHLRLPAIRDQQFQLDGVQGGHEAIQSSGALHAVRLQHGILSEILEDVVHQVPLDVIQLLLLG